MSKLFNALLPQGYAHKRAEIQQYQHFFEMQQSDAVFQLVKVTNVTDEYLNVVMPSAALGSYLRLHSEQICQQIRDNFGVSLALKISSRPEMFNQPEQKHSHAIEADISQQSCDQMQTTADYVDDDELKKALKSLSSTLSKSTKGKAD